MFTLNSEEKHPKDGGGESTAGFGGSLSSFWGALPAVSASLSETEVERN